MTDDKQTTEATQVTPEQMIDSALDSHFGKGQDTPQESSPESEPKETETETEDSSEDTTSKKSVEEPKDETKEPEVTDVPKEFHKHPAWQRILKQRDEAMKKANEAQVPQDVLAKLEEFKQITSTPEYIQTSMKSQGYTQEAINRRLNELGHQLPTSQQDNVQMILSKLNVDPTVLSAEQKAYVSDIAKIADVLFQEKINQILPNQLKPIQETLDTMKQTAHGEKLYEEMSKTVQTEGILDFKSDIEPALVKYMGENPKATQSEIRDVFREINHVMSIERLKTKGKKDTRDEKKKELRQNTPGQSLNPAEMPQRKQGQDIGSYLDSLLDATGIRH